MIGCAVKYKVKVDDVQVGEMPMEKSSIAFLKENTKLK